MPYKPYWFHDAPDGVFGSNLESGEWDELIVKEQTKWKRLHALALIKLHTEDDVLTDRNLAELIDW